MDCGCGAAHGDAGHSGAHLVVEDLEKMVGADRTTLSQVVPNISKAAEEDRSEHPAEWA